MKSRGACLRFFFELLIFPLFLGTLLRELVKGRGRFSFLLQKLRTHSLPETFGKRVIWIHAVSVGEVKASLPLLIALKAKYPDFFFLITTTTETGQKEAARILSQADAILPMPLDSFFVVRRFVSHFRPRYFFLIETDFWPQLLAEIQRQGGKIFLVSGKMSERTYKRLARFPPVAKFLFSSLTAACVQSEEYAKRFAPFLFSTPLFITGNLKFDLLPEPVDKQDWERKFSSSLPWVAITCTHPGEEMLLLRALEGLPIRIFLAPRHPERFSAVAAELKNNHIPFSLWADPDHRDSDLVLVNAMGKLPILYTLSSLAIVGGSFLSGLQGHNVLEPCLYGSFPFFGPFMDSQKEIVDSVLSRQMGRQIEISALRDAVSQALLEDRKNFSVSLFPSVAEATLRAFSSHL